MVSVLCNILNHAHYVKFLESVLTDAKSFPLPVRRAVPSNVEDWDRIVIARSDRRNEVRCARSRCGQSNPKAGKTSIRVSSEASVALVRRGDELDLRGIYDPVYEVERGTAGHAEHVAHPLGLDELSDYFCELHDSHAI